MVRSEDFTIEYLLRTGHVSLEDSGLYVPDSRVLLPINTATDIPLVWPVEDRVSRTRFNHLSEFPDFTKVYGVSLINMAGDFLFIHSYGEVEYHKILHERISRRIATSKQKYRCLSVKLNTLYI